MSDRFKEVARIIAAELGIEKTAEEWNRLITAWITDYRMENPDKTELMTDSEVFGLVMENVRAQREKSEANLRTYEEFINNAPTDAKAEKFIREFMAGFAENCPMELLIRLSRTALEFRRSEMKFDL